MNSFYASVECLHQPRLRDQPVAVGGDAEARHGIILAKNQLAKRCGVKTGEALWQARQKCPDLVIVHPHYDQYIRFSRLAREIYGEYTDRVEPFGLDECWLDVTGTESQARGGEALGHELRRRVKAELGVTVSVGVSDNKIFAKLGSDYKKPDAVTVFSRREMGEKVWPLPVTDLLYVGPATGRKLRHYGVETIGELARTPPEYLQSWFGKVGLMLHGFANGYDLTPVARAGEESPVKSVGNSMTTVRDLVSLEDISAVYWVLCESVAARLRLGGFLCRTVQVGLRDFGLYSFERQLTLEAPSCLATELHRAAMALVEENWDPKRPLRSVGVRGTELLPADAPLQLDLFRDEARRERQERLERSVEDLRRRFGKAVIGRAAARLHGDLWSPDLEKTQVIQPIGLLKGSIS
jgi:DNA polymerase-4